ncbi:cysteine peptidase family C39 domain-containing protein [Thalassobellus sediminis]|uniref:cysteine peptidase family C39 domain-containing protein n=1 Tax=Thalassobellus sediminis TaxID=3367753 RepID=UPI003787C73D
MDNCVNATRKLLNTLNVKNTKKYLEDSILSHPEHPSLLAISDTLEKYNIETLAVKIDQEKLNNMPLPCIVQVKKQGTHVFFVLKKVLANEVEYYDDKSKLVKTLKEDFLKSWTGICLLAETSTESKEIDIDKKLLSSNILKGLKVSIVLFILGWVAISFINSESNATLISSSFTAIYTLLKITGLIVGGLLLWFDVDQYNPTLQNFCTGSSQKINCNSVLNSKHAKLFKGTFSLSELSFSYFFGSFFFLLISSFSIPSLSILALISFVSLPIIAISVYYQAIVIKQWCKFCIIIQTVLVSEILVSFFGNFYSSNLQLETIPLLLALFLIPILTWKLIKPLLEQEKETNLHKRGLKKIKSNPNVLEGLLSKSRKIGTPLDGLGISITNENAKYLVVKVCNPYCGPCAKAHPILEDLVKKGTINLQVLFTVSSDANDLKAKPVSHFLAIDSLGNKKKTQKALDDWYLADQKDYETFASKYPMNGELELQNNKIEAMRNWCKAENIIHTPTLFINGYELPKEYTIEDLTDVLI